MPAGKLEQKNMKKITFFATLVRKESDPDPLSEVRVRIRTKMSRIPNTGVCQRNYFPRHFMIRIDFFILWNRLYWYWLQIKLLFSQTNLLK